MSQQSVTCQRGAGTDTGLAIAPVVYQTRTGRAAHTESDDLGLPRCRPGDLVSGPRATQQQQQQR